MSEHKKIGNKRYLKFSETTEGFKAVRMAHNLRQIHKLKVRVITSKRKGNNVYKIYTRKK